MKKKILGVTLIVTLAVVAAFNINLSKSNAKGDLALANIEALADIELPPVVITCSSGHYGHCFLPGYNLCMRGEMQCWECTYTGYQRDECWCTC